ncbi:glycosyltransferase family 2 protein [Virgibacillus halodenitrificans]|uniref:glycosyltransferase family 2 protein n=1 Tax=Virgibacillus halodenitrificans TaxID=1482 RepID=UPI001F3B5CB3|nr:glycosyltransferase [Virgibacillus halodenitrificans]
MREELISVICTVKNGGKTLTQTIMSVINQDFTNWEFVIVDDGSNDETKSILTKFGEQDRRIKPVYTNGVGRGKALNLAIQKSSGKFIANIDADDLMHPKRLQLQLNQFIENEDIFLVCSDSVIFYNNETPVWEEQRRDKLEYITDNLLIKNRISHSSVMIRKQDLINIGCYNDTLKSQFDYELWLRALAYQKVMVKVPIKLVAKRIHEGQSFENKKRFRYLLRSQKLQVKYALLIRKRVFAVLMITPFRIVLGFLPFQLRKHISFYIHKVL